jgi:hypothetical protein
MLRPFRAGNVLVMTVIAWLSGAACGGAASAPATAERADAEATTSNGEDADDAPVQGAGAEDASPAKRAPCDDGTCTPCGDALCPTGWYCNESAKGGAACGWLPECAKKPTCACLKRVFPGACEERNGGLYVKE